MNRYRPIIPPPAWPPVYKTLSLLKDIGEVLELNFASVGSRYDGNRPYPTPMSFAPGAAKSLIRSWRPWLVFLKKSPGRPAIRSPITS